MRSTGCLKIEKEKMFDIFRDGVYGESDIFVRELISNAYDATVKKKLSESSFLNRSDNSKQEGKTDEKIVVELDEEKGTITFRDYGIGMTFEEMDCYINRMALSGTKEFLKQHLAQEEEKGVDVHALIGNFGLGFYSAFIVADEVEIISKSKISDEENAVHWVGNCNLRFFMEEYEKDVDGTDIILHIKKEKYLKEDEIKKAINKYCRFLSVPIYFKNVHKESCVRVNEPTPMWHRELFERQAMFTFYHNMFADYREPIECINLYNETLGIKGVIFLRNLSGKNVSTNGTIKVYSNGIFVAENVTELIPDFLLMQNGCIDIQRLPLKVSREQLKEDGYAAAIKNYLSEIIGKRLLALYTENPRCYEQQWADLNPFIKLAYIQNRRFRAAIGDALLFEDTEGRFFSVSSLLLHKNNSKKIYYCTDEFCQFQHIKLFENKGIQVLKLYHVMDQPLIRFLEMQDSSIQFLRVDSQAVKELSIDSSLSSEMEQQICSAFTDIVGSRVSAEVVSFDDMDFAAIIMMDESYRRIQDVSELYNLIQNRKLEMVSSNTVETLLVNENSKIVEKMLHVKDKTAKKRICEFIYELARFNRGLPEDTELMSFIKQCQEILNIAAEKF